MKLLSNSFPNDKMLDWSKFKEFADDNLNNAQMMIYLLNRKENIAGIRRKC